MIDLGELERLARAATPGNWFNAEWTAGPRGCEVGDKTTRNRIACELNETDAAYIAACSPTTILELLRIARQHRAVLDAMRAYLPPNGYGLTTAALVSRLVEIMDPGGKPPEG